MLVKLRTIFFPWRIPYFLRICSGNKVLLILKIEPSIDELKFIILMQIKKIKIYAKIIKTNQISPHNSSINNNTHLMHRIFQHHHHICTWKFCLKEHSFKVYPCMKLHEMHAIYFFSKALLYTYAILDLSGFEHHALAIYITINLN